MTKIDFNAKRFDRAIGENRKIGGTVILTHPYLPPDFKIAAPVRDIVMSAFSFAHLDPAAQKRVAKSVNSAIKEVRGSVLSGKATTEEAVRMAQDIVLYTAHEIHVGRLNFDDLEYVE